MIMNEKEKKIGLWTLVMLVFLPSFGFTSMVKNVVAFGPAAIPSWLIAGLLFFLPMSIMMAELASVNQNKDGGIYAWVECGLGPDWAFISTWSYYIANLFFLQMVCCELPNHVSWAFLGDTGFNDSNTKLLIWLGVLSAIILTFVATRNVNILSKIGDIGGKLLLISTALFIIFAILGVIIGRIPSASEFTAETVIPKFDADYFSTFAWIIYAASGIELAGTYIPKIKDPEKTFPKGMVIAITLIIGAFILGSLAVCQLMPNEELRASGIQNASVLVYRILADKWGIDGYMVVKIYAFIFVFSSIAKYIMFFESPIRAMFSEVPEGTFPKFITKKREDGRLTNALWIQCAILCVMILIPLFGVNGINNFFILLQNMTALSVVVPYVILIAAYYCYRIKKGNTPFVFIKSEKMVTAVTIVTSILGIVGIVGAGLGEISAASGATDAALRLTSIYGGPLALIAVGLLLRRATKSYYSKTK